MIFQALTSLVKKFFVTFATVKKIVLLILCILVCSPAFSQKKSKERYPMYYYVDENGDTLFVDQIDPVWCFPKGTRLKKGDWRRQYKLVYNFNKVYPYALAGKKMMAQVDSVLAVDATKRGERNAYTRDVMFELFDIFASDIKHMTISQGVVLMRLVDRECGIPPFEIIKELTQKTYFHHTGYLGGDRFVLAKDMLANNPVRMVEMAVRGMIPKNRLGDQIYKKLHVYAGPEHPHAAQQPEVLEIDIR